MKHLVFLLLFSLIACHKEPIPEDPRDARRIEGAWQSLLPAHPDWKYEFRDGLLRQYVEDFGVIISDHTYPYAIRQDTILIGGDDTNAARRWIVLFHCDDLVECRTQGGSIIAPTLYLKRMQ